MSREIFTLPPYGAVCGWTRSDGQSWFSCATATGFESWTKEKGIVICCYIGVSLGIHQQSKSGFFCNTTDLWSSVSPAESSTWWVRFCHLSLVAGIHLVKTGAVVAPEDGAGRVAAAVLAVCINALRRSDQAVPAHELRKGNSAGGTDSAQEKCVNSFCKCQSFHHVNIQVLQLPLWAGLYTSLILCIEVFMGLMIIGLFRVLSTAVKLM